jgi:hypothetical protein
MHRAVLVLLLLAAVVLAGPAPGADGAELWQALRWGEDPGIPGAPTDGSGQTTPNENEMTVLAAATSSSVEVRLAKSHSALDLKNSAFDDCTTWFGLRFVGSPTARNHSWCISTTIRGDGTAQAGSDSSGRAWGESYQLIRVTGDHQNLCGGALAVKCGTGAHPPLPLPEEFLSSEGEPGPAAAEDGFDVARSESSRGNGETCRIEVEVRAGAAGLAGGTSGQAWTKTSASLGITIEMRGRCTIAGMEVEDRFVLTGAPDDPTEVIDTPQDDAEEDGAAKAPADEPDDGGPAEEGEEDAAPGAGEPGKDPGSEEQAPTEAPDVESGK